MYLIYLSFGEANKPYECEIVYSLLSFDSVASADTKENTAILIYTDHDFHLPDRLSHLKITIVGLEKNEVGEWLIKSNNYPYVLKTRVVHHFLKMYRSSGLFVDSDTFFLSDPAPIFQQIERGSVIMHLQERRISEIPELQNFFLNSSFKKCNGYEFTVEDFCIWNSGVIGLNFQLIGIVEEAIFLTEQISNHKGWPPQFHTIEQIVLSFNFRNNNIVSAEQFIIHYWFAKKFRGVLGKHFNFFHKNDKLLAEQLIAYDTSKVIPDTIKYRDLPDIMKNLLKAYEPNSTIGIYSPYCSMEIILEDLPLNSFIGQFLRQ